MTNFLKYNKMLLILSKIVNCLLSCIFAKRCMHCIHTRCMKILVVKVTKYILHQPGKCYLIMREWMREKFIAFNSSWYNNKKIHEKCHNRKCQQGQTDFSSTQIHMRARHSRITCHTWPISPGLLQLSD